MILSDIPNGVRVMIDTAVMLHAITEPDRRDQYKTVADDCRMLLDRCGGGRVRGFMTSQAVTGLWRRLLALEAFATGVSSEPSALIRLRPRQVMKSPSQFARTRMRTLLRSCIDVVPITGIDHLAALSLSRRYDLSIAESLDVAAGLRVADRPLHIAVASTRFQGVGQCRGISLAMAASISQITAGEQPLHVAQQEELFQKGPQPS